MQVNLDEEGVGRVFFDPRGKLVMSFAWGQGKRLNNQAEWVELSLGLKLMLDNSLQYLQVFGDSWIVTQSMNKMVTRYKEELGKTRKRILLHVKQLNKFHFYHIKR